MANTVPAANAILQGNGSVYVPTTVPTFNAGTKIKLAVSAPADADVATSSVVAWVDETANELTFKVKYADGTTVKSGTVALA